MSGVIYNPVSSSVVMQRSKDCDASPSSAEGQTGLRCPLQSRDAALRGRVRRKDGRNDRRKEGRIGRPKDCAKGKLKDNRGVDVLRKNILEINR